MAKRVKIPKYLMKKIILQHVGPKDFLYLNELCIATFQKETNLQEIAILHKVKCKVRRQRITEPHEIEALSRDILLHPIPLMKQYIKTVITDTKYKLYDPFTKLEYSSADIELKTKIPILYPKINSEELFSDYHTFLRNNGLEECRVDMSKDNQVFDTVQARIALFTLNHGKNGPASLESYIMQRYLIKLTTI